MVGRILSWVQNLNGTLTIQAEFTFPKITKTVVGLDTFNLDTKENYTHIWKLMVDKSVNASGTGTLVPLEQKAWWQSLPWQTINPGFHTFQLNITNAYGNNTYTIAAMILFGDVDNNNIANMLDPKSPQSASAKQSKNTNQKQAQPHPPFLS
jgi:hypothetical protein